MGGAGNVFVFRWRDAAGRALYPANGRSVAGKGGLFINLGYRDRDREREEGREKEGRQLVLQNVNMKQNGRIKRV